MLLGSENLMGKKQRETKEKRREFAYPKIFIQNKLNKIKKFFLFHVRRFTKGYLFKKLW